MKILIAATKMEIAAEITLSYNGDECVLSLGFDNTLLVKSGRFPFFVLQEIRKELEQNELYLLCNGSRYDVYPSGMTAGGTIAYVHQIGKSATQRVDILDEVENTLKIESIKKQELYRKEWISSLNL